MSSEQVCPFECQSPLGMLEQCGGLYICPIGSDGKRLGPLVGYAGRDSTGAQFVGDLYANFAMAEKNPSVMQEYASMLYNLYKMFLVEKVQCLCAMPMGGITFAAHLGLKAGKQVIFLEKKVIAVATKTEREKSELVAGRHEIQKDFCYAIVEDVTNNFSTTLQAIKLIESAGGVVVAIVSILNRSPKHQNRYCPSEEKIDLPILSVVSRSFPEYRQTDLEVSEDIAKCNVVLKPKAEWPRLMEAMAKAGPI